MDYTDAEKFRSSCHGQPILRGRICSGCGMKCNADPSESEVLRLAKLELEQREMPSKSRPGEPGIRQASERDFTSEPSNDWRHQ